jgi:hypothetical protein
MLSRAVFASGPTLPSVRCSPSLWSHLVQKRMVAQEACPATRLILRGRRVFLHFSGFDDVPVGLSSMTSAPGAYGFFGLFVLLPSSIQHSCGQCVLASLAVSTTRERAEVVGRLHLPMLSRAVFASGPTLPSVRCSPSLWSHLVQKRMVAQEACPATRLILRGRRVFLHFSGFDDVPVGLSSMTSAPGAYGFFGLFVLLPSSIQHSCGQCVLASLAVSTTRERAEVVGRLHLPMLSRAVFASGPTLPSVRCSPSLWSHLVQKRMVAQEAFPATRLILRGRRVFLQVAFQVAFFISSDIVFWKTP